MKLDNFDIKTLAELQNDFRASFDDINNVIGLSVTSCYRRIQRLKETGIIGDKAVLLSHSNLGLNFEAHVEVKLAISIERFERLVNLYPEIIKCYAVEGDVDFILRVITRSSVDFDHFIRDRFLERSIISSTETFIVVRRVVDRQALPLKHVTLNKQ